MAKRKKAGMHLEVEIPDGVDVEINNNVVSVKGPKGELSREIPTSVIKISKDNKKIYLSIDSGRRAEKALLGTMRGHIRNMVKGVSEGITYKLKILYSHFPVSVRVAKNQVLIENFLGERHLRRARILENVNVDIKGQEIIVNGFDKERVSQTAANIEQATRIKGMDPRVFQDGIYIIEKDGKPIK